MEADGLEHLLSIDDPVERKLALKSRHVEPYHLRLALQDEDPEVREAAANHPDLTPELMHETIHGDDRWLASLIVKRPDITDEQLDHAMRHEDLHHHVVAHKALTDAQRQRLADDPTVPEGLKQDLVKSDLMKNIGHLLYPHFGEGQLHQLGAYYPVKNRRRDDFRATSKVQAGGFTEYNARPKFAPTPGERRKFRIRVRPRKEPETMVDEGVRRRAFGLPPETPEGEFDVPKLAQQFKAVRPIVGSKSDHANEQHEVQHAVFGRLAQKFGMGGRDAILKETLKRLPAEHKTALSRMFDSYSMKSYHPGEWNEESIAFLQNYLMDPVYRQKVHVAQQIHRNVQVQHDQIKSVRSAWNELRRIGQNLKPEDVGLVHKSDDEMLLEAAQSLSKARSADGNSVVDHLGFDERKDTILNAIEFLIGKPVDPEVYRARLMDCDDDVEAALLAGGLTLEDRPKLDAVLSINGELSKAEPQMPKQILPANHSAAEMAADLQWAVDNGQIETVHLGGKHSAGTLMARDKDGDLFLLKPGSGKQSPAAGASEERASQSRREAAYSAVARQMHIPQVPQVELVLVDGKEVAAIRMLGLDWTGLARAREQDPQVPRRVLRPHLDDGSIYKWAVMDYVLGNPDRHGNNLMIGPEGKVALIDHGSAFAGPSFDPGRDLKSFVPYYLRIWGPDKGWSKMSDAERMAVLPVLNDQTDAEVKEWIKKLDVGSIADTMYRYGIDPTSSLHRLQAVLAETDQDYKISEALNRLWVR